MSNTYQDILLIGASLAYHEMFKKSYGGSLKVVEGFYEGVKENTLVIPLEDMSELAKYQLLAGVAAQNTMLYLDNQRSAYFIEVQTGISTYAGKFAQCDINHVNSGEPYTLDTEINVCYKIIPPRKVRGVV